ncbi:MAG: dsDNA nuclease domain-containing protein [Candidatus Odinarchaeia archaeon]
MTDIAPTPLEVWKSDDRGSDVAKRYRYQASYAATVALKLLEENPKYKQIICEQIEDVLIKTSDDRYIGCQVKTKDSSTFTFNSAAIKKSIKRFVYTHLKYGDLFAHYILVTNCGFTRTGDYRNMEICLTELRENEKEKKKDKKFMKKIKDIAKEIGTSQKKVLETLIKTYVEKFSSLIRYETILSEDIAISMNIDLIHRPTLRDCSIKLIDMAFRKSADIYDTNEITYYKSLEKLESIDTKELVRSKTITKEDVEKILVKLRGRERLLSGDGELEEIPTYSDDLTIMEIKMDKGGILPDQVNEIHNKSIDIEKLVRHWKYNISTEKALEYYRHVKTIVRHESLQSYYSKDDFSENFGREMLRDIEARLKRRYELDIVGKIPYCYEEDLTGFCGLLTDQCILWWSEEFEI